MSRLEYKNSVQGEFGSILFTMTTSDAASLKNAHLSPIKGINAVLLYNLETIRERFIVS